MPDLLIELFSEEIPARLQARAAEDLKKLMTDGLVEAGLTYSGAAAFATPRRLALAVEGLPGLSPDSREERKGPKVGAPEKAIEGFLRSTGLTRDQIEARDTGKGEVWFAVIEHKGRPAADIVAEVLDGVIRNFPWPKSMRWGAGDLRWVRPLHSILAILSDEQGAEVVPLTLDGLTAGDSTRGHRFMAPDPIRVTSFEDYAAKLRAAHVMLDPAERAEAIWHDATQKAFALGYEVVEDRALLAEVAGLVEWPVVLMGDIADDFVTLPPEVLQTSMREHQKFFSVRNPATKRIEKFITVANRETADNGATILAGNRKVLAARLSDARFFWDNDLRRIKAGGLEAMTGDLDNVTFHRELGSQADRIDRIARLARDIAPLVGADAAEAKLAATVAKADLASEMVYEFPELQGTMGRYYARAAGLSEAVAEACEAHYAPLGPSDAVPTSPVSIAVALADKLDLLTGFWVIDEKPTGSKDPFALRRAALGVIRIILAGRLRLRLDRFIDSQILKHEIMRARSGEVDDADIAALEQTLDEIADKGIFRASFTAVLGLLKKNGTPPATGEGTYLARIGKAVPDLSDDLLAFFHERLKVHLRAEGIRHDVIDACLNMPANDDLTLLVNRAEALAGVLATDDGANLIQGFKRANNILTQAEEADGVEYSYGADIKYAEDDSEKALFAALDAAEAKIAPAMKSEDFATAMTAMASLRAPIDAFFETVQINTDNAIVRRNRLNLLARIRDTCLSVADLTKIEG
ncbi:glycine--tRNA ligase subunit beta [Maritimibacter fusiformis]|uniref:Glycine--tRNA ligase beta subunit n=1 Tax=Maritimibacter fusiformis TaxID=2603819 RepID=A0A5D0RQR9_9RHOB|nr:glycine--tRNA ligase subunit beta [Maritimibacter fusiformis]TYB83008.1 glycine--tRNA ligase subunit beta [Maritimibacter fusiformis]